MKKFTSIILLWLIALLCNGQQINGMEYFIDTDPGFGNGTTVSVTAADDLTKSFNIPLGTLSDGLHRLFVRVRNSEGRWSMSQNFNFFKYAYSAPQGTSLVSKLEYFFDTDPGFGNATSVSLTAGENITKTFAVSLNSVSTGFHRLFVRAQNQDGAWSFGHSMFFYCYNISTQTTASINKVEYFIDTDPGYGSATGIDVTPTASLSQNININLTSVTTGFHRLYIRVRNTQGKWSYVHSVSFYRYVPDVQTISQIYGLEYFVDTDPGYGAANPVAVSPADNVTKTFNVNLSSVTNGFHTLYVRAKNALGKWSAVQRISFYRYTPDSQTHPQISKLEYFIDTDPGYGAATAVPVSPADNVTKSFNVNLSEVTNGFHSIYVRAQNTEGKWSFVHKALFYRYTPQTQTISKINKLEYFIDTDPGYGAATQVDVSPAENATKTFNIDLTSVSNGLHQLFVRSRNANGKWSTTHNFVFLRYTVPQTVDNKIVKLEYFVDEDPGYGSATSLPVPPDYEIVKEFNLNLLSMQTGFHTLYVRALSANGKWSMTHSFYFYRHVPQTASQNKIVGLEYFWDTDPGYGNGIQQEISPTDSVSRNYNIDVSCLATGDHSLFFRTRSLNGKWSMTALAATSVSPDNPAIIVGGQNPFIVGDSCLLHVSQGNCLSYQWKKNDVDIPNATLSYIYAKTSGNYTVSVVHQGISYTSEPVEIITWVPPTVLTEMPTNVGISSAVFHATVNPNSQPTDVYFEYGTSIFFGESILATPASISGNQAVALNANVINLSADKTYFYRIVAVNSIDSVFGEAQTFTTSPNYLEHYEYWFDSDFENRVSGTTNDSQTFQFSETFDINDYTAGEHTFNIRFLDSKGQWGSVLSQTFTKIFYLAAPTNFIALPVSETQINLTWNDNSLEEEGYEIQRSLLANSGFETIHTTAADVTSYNNDGLVSSTKYYYRIRAKHTLGDSEFSSTISASTFCGTAAPVTSNQSSCFGSATPDLTATGSNIRWYSDILLTTLVHSGSTFVTGLTDVCDTTFYVTQTQGDCESPAVAVTLTIKPLPNSPIAENQSSCVGSVTPDLTAVGESIKWYSDAELTNLVHEGNSYNTGISNLGTHDFYVTQTVNACESEATQVDLIINQVPATPSASDVAVCYGVEVPELVAVGTDIRWYADSELLEFLYQGSNFIPDMTDVGIYQYYATQTVNGCESSPKEVKLTINTSPQTLEVEPISVCFGTEYMAFTVEGVKVEWFLDAQLTNLVDTGNTFLPTVTQASTYKWYVTQTVSACRSIPAEAVLTIFDLPEITDFDLTNESDCAVNDGTITITATDAEKYSINGGETFQTNNVFENLSTGSYILAAKSSHGCITVGETVEITSPNTPPRPTVSASAVYCSADVIQPMTAAANSGGILYWYNTVSQTTPIATGNSLIPDNQIGTTTYYIVEQAGNCRSLPAVIVITIFETPDMPSADNQYFCAGDEISAMTAEGTNIKWYGNAQLTQLLESGNEFETQETQVGVYNYCVTQTIGSCESEAKQVSLTISLPPNPQVSGINEVCLHQTKAVYSTPNVENHTYTWTVTGGGITEGQGTNQVTVDWSIAGTGKVSVNEALAATDCNTNSQEFAVTVKQDVPLEQPEVIVKFNAVLVCKNVNNSFDKYQWCDATGEIPNANLQFYEPKTPLKGDYYVVTTDRKTCKAESNHVELSEVQKSETIKVYPNPAQNEISVDVFTFEKKFNILIFNSLGIEMKSKKVDNNGETVRISVSDIPNGIYFLKIEELSYYQVIIINRN